MTTAAVVEVHSRATEVWAALVPLMAGRRWLLVSSDGGKSYRQRGRRLITPTPPCQPAAIPIYDDHGMTRLLALDLDVGRGGAHQVQADVLAVQRLTDRVGARVFVDRSPNGGHHVYLPLAEPISLGEARSIVQAIAARTPSLDVQPMTNAQTGVIRPPGSLYKGGRGHQQLVTPLAVAYDMLQRPNPPAVLHRLRNELAPELLALPPDFADQATLSDDLADAPWHPLPGGPRALTPAYRQIAATGTYDTSRYQSPSEARQAVLCSAVAAGMRLVDVARRLETGLWPGLASFYSRYAARHWRRALTRDWKRAHRYVDQQRTLRAGNHHVRSGDTRGPESHARPPEARAEPSGRGEARTAYQHIRAWITTVDNYAPDHLTPGEHMTLRTLAEAAQKVGRIEVEFGVRNLSVGAGRSHHSGLAKQLVALREAPDPFIELVEQHQGVVADRYRLRIPEHSADLARRRSWRRGAIHGVRPVFRELGPIAALAYETLENASEPLTGRNVARALRRAPAAVQAALDSLAGWDLARRVNGRWIHSPTANLLMAAEALGVLDDIQAQLTRIRAERERWWTWLGVRRLERRTLHLTAANAIAEKVSRADPARPLPPEPPPADGPFADEIVLTPVPPIDPEYTSLQLLEQVLGATVITDARRERRLDAVGYPRRHGGLA